MENGEWRTENREWRMENDSCGLKYSLGENTILEISPTSTYQENKKARARFARLTKSKKPEINFIYC